MKSTQTTWSDDQVSADDSSTSEPEAVRDVCGVLDRVEAASEGNATVSLGMVMDAFGHQSFVPLLLLPGLVMLAPGVGDIPGVPVLMGCIVILVAAQLVMRREHVWIPQWLERRQLQSHRVAKVVGWLRRPAQWVDRLTKQRYTPLLNHAGVTVMALVCILIAASTPALEFIPFSANVAGAAITTFAVALLARDGLIAVIAMGLAMLTAAWMVYGLV